MGRVEGRVAIVTGGALGIGKACCLLLAKEGAKVAVTDILDQEGQKLANQIKSSGGVAEFWHLDVSNEKEVQKSFANINGEFGKIDILVNNAGIAGVSKPTQGSLLLHQACDPIYEENREWKHNQSIFHLWNRKCARCAPISCF
jgi:NAD(P)-dependent dehydrogenase (short-subunit alcohol dehydrogenase family)